MRLDTTFPHQSADFSPPIAEKSDTICKKHMVGAPNAGSKDDENREWHRDELILALDLHLRHRPKLP